MKNQISILVVAMALIFSISSCSKDNCVKPSGKVVTEERTISTPFQGVILKGSANIIITQEANTKVEVEASDNVMAMLKTEVIGDNLVIDLDGCVKNNNNTTVRISNAAFNNIEIDGSGDVSATNQLTADALTLAIDGSGDMTLDLEAQSLTTSINGSGDIRTRGAVDNLNVTIEGAGDLDFFNLIADECDVNLNGSGDIEVFVNSRLNVTIDGSGDVKYKGNVTDVTSNISGSGDLSRR